MESGLDRLGPVPPWLRRYYRSLALSEAFVLARREGVTAIVPARWDMSLLLKGGDEILVEPVVSESGPVTLNYSILRIEQRPTQAKFLTRSEDEVNGFRKYRGYGLPGKGRSA